MRRMSKSPLKSNLTASVLLSALPACCAHVLQTAIEFTTASVTPPGLDKLADAISAKVPLPLLPGDAVQQILDVAETGLHISNNRSMHYSNIRQRGRWTGLPYTAVLPALVQPTCGVHRRPSDYWTPLWW